MTKRNTRLALRSIAVTATAAVCLIGVSRSGATFGGANGLLVYQAQTGRHIQLFTIRADGTGRRQITHLRATGVPIVKGPYKFGDTRAVLIEDLDGLGVELIEVK